MKTHAEWWIIIWGVHAFHRTGSRAPAQAQTGPMREKTTMNPMKSDWCPTLTFLLICSPFLVGKMVVLLVFTIRTDSRKSRFFLFKLDKNVYFFPFVTGCYHAIRRVIIWIMYIPFYPNITNGRGFFSTSFKQTPKKELRKRSPRCVHLTILPIPHHFTP